MARRPVITSLLFWVTFWPGSVLAGLAAPAVWRRGASLATQFLLAWLMPSWLVFEAVITKLPHYVLPLYPAIAILIAGVLERDALVKARWLVRGTVGWFVFPGIIAIAIAVGLHRRRPRSRHRRLAVRGGGGDLRPVRLVALRRRRRRTRAAARHGGVGLRRHHRLRA